MKGLEVSEKFFWSEVSPLIENFFPKLKGAYTAGLVGYGSDVLGYDDEISRAKAWGPRCYLWLKCGDYDKYAKKIVQVLCDHLPQEFLGFPTFFKTNDTTPEPAPAQPEEKGKPFVVITTVPKYLKTYCGLNKISLELTDWLTISEQNLLELTRGKIFCDPLGEMTRVRTSLVYFPDQIWFYKMLSTWESLNNLDLVRLCMVRGDLLSARIAFQKIIEKIFYLIFLLNRRYCPGHIKWFSKEFYNLPKLVQEVGGKLEECLIIPDIKKGLSIIEEIIWTLALEYKDSAIVDLANADISESSKTSAIIKCMTDALRSNLPPDLKNLNRISEIRAC